MSSKFPQTATNRTIVIQTYRIKKACGLFLSRTDKANAIIELFETSEKIPIAREERERKERRRREEAEHRYQRALRQEEEFKKVTALENTAWIGTKPALSGNILPSIEEVLQNEVDEDKRSRNLE